MKRTLGSWRNLFLITFLAAYLYIFNEWLFSITRPYFMNDLGFPEQLQIFLTASALLAGLGFLGLLPLVLLSLLPPLHRFTGLLIKIGALLPAVIFATLILIMADNFTYTVFKWGIVSTSGLSRALYGAAYLAAIVLCYRRILASLARLDRQKRIWGLRPNWVYGLAAGVFILSLALLAAPDQNVVHALPAGTAAEAEQRPNILLLTADGMNATHMSVYGYARDTTPNISRLAGSALVAENAFSNAGNSPASVVSLYTGKYPATTRMVFPPDILKERDAYEHLPGILRAQGYETVQITVPYYLDARTLNVADSFDRIKMSSAVPSKLLNKIGKFMPGDHALFTDETIKRIVDRLRHISFIKKMDNPYLEVTGMYARRVDIERWVYLRQEIQDAAQPLFIHVHLMVTHGEDFFPMEQKFSAGQSIEDQEPWSVDFYDDSILDFDRNVGDLADGLSRLGLMERTILIIGSDHGMEWDQLKRVPLIIRFPQGQYAGRIQANVQNLDIAPTLLDYLGLDQPGWMRGRSLIAGVLEQRPIFGVDSVKRDRENGGAFAVTMEDVKPPFYQFTGISLIYCRKWYHLELAGPGWDTGEVEGSTSTCTGDNEITEEQALQEILGHLRENGFEVSSLEGISPGSGK